MTRMNVAICLAAALVLFCLWAVLNRPEIEPPWPERIQGFAFSPLRPWNDPFYGNLPTEAEIDEDLQLLAGKTNAIRTYSVEGVLGRIPELARRHGLNVTLGAWLGRDPAANAKEIERVIEVARTNFRNVIRVIVGNETLYRGDLTIEQLTGYLDRVRGALSVPVSTAEPWNVWHENAVLAEHADFVAVHMLPYWEGVHVDEAVDRVERNYDLLTETFPDREIVIAEVGWPSNGRTRRSAVASTANEATFLRRFLDRAEALDYVYYVMEAFDQPWKMRNEGAVGAYWGVYDTGRLPKFAFAAPIVGIPEWHVLAAVSAAIAASIFMLLVADSTIPLARGRGFLAAIAFVAATGAVWVVYSYSRQYPTPATVGIGCLLVVGLIVVVLVVLAEAHEWAEAVWGARRRRIVPVETVREKPLPFVSIHIPACNEPPQMLIETLDALSRLDYPRFEVIVIDNNTRDTSTWLPVARSCEERGPRFHLYHEDRLAGFKAGALNYALRRTAPAAEVVAVIDSDYVVEKEWLRDLAPQFHRPETVIVQAPQDYRDAGENLFKAMCYTEYQGFFKIGMVTRNERNAIIQHGTMTMVRRAALEQVGGWAEWCITEDAELGLRIFETGGEAIYVPQSYGRGLMPDTFVDFKKQRYRWAYGAVQIIRRHRRSLLGGNRSRLTPGQRYHFLAGWLPWLADSINLIFTFAALAWSVLMIHYPKSIDPPLALLTSVPLSFFAFKLVKMFYIYRQRVDESSVRACTAALAGLSLTHTIAKAVLHGFVSKNLPFFRTPKRVRSRSVSYILQSAREEFFMATALTLAMYGIVRLPEAEGPDQLFWLIVLGMQSIPYWAAVCMSCIAACRLPAGLVFAAEHRRSVHPSVGADESDHGSGAEEKPFS